jgi:hypothetical protein
MLPICLFGVIEEVTWNATWLVNEGVGRVHESMLYVNCLNFTSVVWGVVLHSVSIRRSENIVLFDSWGLPAILVERIPTFQFDYFGFKSSGLLCLISRLNDYIWWV